MFGRKGSSQATFYSFCLPVTISSCNMYAGLRNSRTCQEDQSIANTQVWSCPSTRAPNRDAGCNIAPLMRLLSPKHPTVVPRMTMSQEDCWCFFKYLLTVIFTWSVGPLAPIQLLTSHCFTGSLSYALYCMKKKQKIYSSL